MMKKAVMMILLGFSTLMVSGQDFQDLIRAGAGDGSRYLEAYMEPAMLSFGNGLAGGWLNTAKNHKLFGVDITISANFASIPDDATSFLFRNADYNAFEINGSSTEAELPTFGGGETSTQLRIPVNTSVDLGNGQSYTFSEEVVFDAIAGVGSDLPFTSAPAPTVQLGLGLMKNTDLKLRYIPSVNTGDFELDLFGIGFMHDIKQWIPGLKLAPIDLAGFVGTTKMRAALNMEDVNETDFEIRNGSTEMEVSATTVQVMISKKLAVFTPYASVGYNFTSSSINVKGDYVFKDPSGSDPDETISDPISLNFAGGNSPRVTVGAQLKLLILTLHADYTMQKYSTFTAGIGLSVR